MTAQHNCPCTGICPLQHAMEMIGGKWKLSILCSLTVDGSTRYNDLKRKLGGISNTMLAKSLKEMEEDGLITRTEYLEVPSAYSMRSRKKAERSDPSLRSWHNGLWIHKTRKTLRKRNASEGFFGGEDGIRTHVPVKAN